MKIRSITIGAATVAILAGCGKTQDFAQAATVPQNGITNGAAVKGNNDLGKSVVALIADMNQGQALCTGTVVAEDTILTAAHCVDNKPTKVTIIFSKKIKGVKADETRVAKDFEQNPFWKGEEAGGQGDLALIRFDGGLPKDYVPVELADQNVKLGDGTDVTLLGYGVTNGLKNIGAGVMRETTTKVIGEKSPTQIMTDGEKSSVCFGDSGGPAFTKENDKLVQWGVASSVLNQACNEASVHTAIMNYRAWISSTTTRLRLKTHKKPAAYIATAEEYSVKALKKEHKEPKENKEAKPRREAKPSEPRNQRGQFEKRKAPAPAQPDPRNLD